MKVKNTPVSARQYLTTFPDRGAVHEVPTFHSSNKRPLEVYFIRNALVVGNPTLVITPTGEILYESSSYRDFPEPLSERIKGTTLDETNARQFDGEYCLLCGIWDDQFWHWMTEYLPKVLVAEAAGFTGDYLIPQRSGFIGESLEMLGVSDSRLIEYDRTITRLGSLAVIDIRDFPLCSSLVSALRTRMLEAVTGDDPSLPSERIYIARKNPERPRRIVNERQFMEVLERFEFRRVYMEELPLSEQVKIASLARVLVGPHGAGLVHALFMPRESLVVECFSPNYILTGHVLMFGLLGHRYYSIVGLNGPLWRYKAGMDVEVDMTLFEATLRRELCQCSDQTT